MSLEPILIVNIAVETPLKTLLLGGVLAVTGLSTFFNWRTAKFLKEANMADKSIQMAALPEDVPKDCNDTNSIEGETSNLRWAFDGATRVGKVRTENQDAFVIWKENETSGFAAVFDGAGGIAGGREASQSAAETCLAIMKDTAKSELSPDERLNLALEAARQSAADQSLEGITTAILIYVLDDRLYFATLGDGAAAIVWPDGMVSQLLVPHHILGQPDNIIAGFIGQDCKVSARTGMIKIEPGVTLMLMSDGASDLFPYQDFAEKREDFAKHFTGINDTKLSEHFLALIEDARDPDTKAYLHHDNMTLILGHLTEVPTKTPLSSPFGEQPDA